MTLKQACAIIENETKCVMRADANKCDRDCENCDLVLPTKYILFAYAIAIGSIKALADKIPEGLDYNMECSKETYKALKFMGFDK